MNHSILRTTLATLFAMSLFFAFMPEVMKVTNSTISFVIQVPFPPKNIQKSPLTNGITRDFIALRISFKADTINPRSKTIFVLVHFSVLLFGTLLVFISFKKDKRE